MSDKLTSEKKLNFSINNISDHADIVKLGRAFSIPERLMILQLLQAEPKYLIEIAEQLDIPLSSVSRHIDVLAEAGLIFISYKPGPKGHSKLCAKAALSANISFEDVVRYKETAKYVTEMPVGLFSDCDITAPCGMVGREAKIGDFDNPSVFFPRNALRQNCFGSIPVLSVINCLPHNIIAIKRSASLSKYAPKRFITAINGRAISR